MESLYFQTKQMTVGYDGKPLIRDISISLRKGEIVTLIGPNGAGKSTILKSITRQLSLLAGSIYLGKENLLHLGNSALSKKQAVVLTDRIKAERMTCRDVVATGRYPYTGLLGITSREDEQKVTDALHLVHADALQELDFGSISDGQRQRILLAKAICQEPEMIVLDEPTSYLDIRHKLEFLGILKDLARKKNTAILMSLHELDLAQKISDQVLCVNGDTIARYGTPEDIFTEDTICHLYGITAQTGSYNMLSGCAELPPVPKGADLFVIGGGGSAASLYRTLQRKDIPFVTGILPQNDIDYAAARHLTTEIISVPAFEPVSKELYEAARKRMLSCSKVLCPLTHFGTYNNACQKLFQEAASKGLLRS